MAYQATVLEVMIASPGDVLGEREVVRDVVSEWNAMYARERAVMLHAVGWETHSSPELAGRPQQMINERLLAHADLLVGIFWTRVGTPTGNALSGSIEEIEEHLRQNKPVMLYFSDAPVKMSDVDQEQYRLLIEFRKWAQSRGLVESFANREDFRTKFRRHLPITLRDNQHLRRALPLDNGASALDGADPTSRRPAGVSLGDEARVLLREAVEHQDGTVMIMRHLGGVSIAAGNKELNEPGNRRSAARWVGAVQELTALGFLMDHSGRGEIFEVTDAGYRFIEGQC